MPRFKKMYPDHSPVAASAAISPDYLLPSGTAGGWYTPIVAATVTANTGRTGANPAIDGDPAGCVFDNRTTDTTNDLENPSATTKMRWYSGLGVGSDNASQTLDLNTPINFPDNTDQSIMVAASQTGSFTPVTERPMITTGALNISRRGSVGGRYNCTVPNVNLGYPSAGGSGFITVTPDTSWIYFALSRIGASRIWSMYTHVPAMADNVLSRSVGLGDNLVGAASTVLNVFARDRFGETPTIATICQVNATVNVEDFSNFIAYSQSLGTG